jgi:plasmid stabilization system protein ParE
MPQAVEDLEAIREFIARDSPLYADLVTERLVTAADILEQFPQAGRIVPEHSRGDLRELVRPPYRIVYRLRGDGADILTVFRASRQIPDISSPPSDQ